MSGAVVHSASTSIIVIWHFGADRRNEFEAAASRMSLCPHCLHVKAALTKQSSVNMAIQPLRWKLQCLSMHTTTWGYWLCAILDFTSANGRRLQHFMPAHFWQWPYLENVESILKSWLNWQELELQIVSTVQWAIDSYRSQWQFLQDACKPPYLYNQSWASDICNFECVNNFCMLADVRYILQSSEVLHL